MTPLALPALTGESRYFDEDAVLKLRAILS